MTDISKNWLDLSVNSNILKPTYIGGFIDVCNNIVGRENLWVENNKDIGDTRLGLGIVDPSFMIDIMSDDPKIRLTNTSINAATQNDSNLGTINIMSPSNNNSITSSIICQNVDTDYDDNGSLIFTTDNNVSNIEDKDKMIVTSNGDLGIGLIPSINLNPSRTSIIAGSSGSRRSIIMGNIKCNTLIGNGSIPVGGISMWSGIVNNKSPQDINNVIYNNWKLCDGNTYNGILTPRMTGLFIVGAGNSYNVNEISGNSSVILTTNNLPSHRHETSYAGNHTHSAIVGKWNFGFDNTPHAIGTDTNNYGKDLSEDPTDSVDWTHTHTIASYGASEEIDNRPAFYGLAYFMRVE